MTKFDGVDT